MRRRSALRLPPYTERRWNRSKGSWSYLFHVPSWARNVAPDDSRGPCPLKSEALGTDYTAAVERAERILLPQLDAWRTRGMSEFAAPKVARGTFDWMVSIYRASPQYTELSARQKQNFEYGLGIASRHPLRNDPSGRERFGQLSLREITQGVVDQLYSKVKQDTVPAVDAGGQAVLDGNGQPTFTTRPRLRRGQEVIKSCRRAWKVARRKETQWVPSDNPFEKAEVEAPKSGKTVPATWEQTLAFVEASDHVGQWSIGTAAMVAFCWFQREEHIMGVPRHDGHISGLLWGDYRPTGDPGSVLVRHPKTGEIVTLPLYSDDGVPLFPELMERLDKAPRRGTLVCLRDKPDATGVYRLWPTGAASAMAPFIRRVSKIRDTAGLPKEITFRSFRHGGFTAAGDADLSDADINAVGAKTDATLDIYRKGTIEQRRRALTRLLDERSKRKRLST